jgi:flagellin
MAIYFNTNLPETRGLLAFDRTTNKINDILQRLDTGYRINSGKDDPTGLIKREGLRLEMKGLQSAINNSIAGQSLLSVAEKAMGSVASLLTGDPTDSQDLGIIGLLNGGSASEITAGINQLADTIDAISRTTIYNGKQIINGAYDYNALATTGATSISNIKVTSADITEGASTDVKFEVTDVAKKAGVKLDDLEVAADKDYTVTLTDGNGRFVSVEFKGTSGSATDYAKDILAGTIKSALSNNADIDLEITDDGTNYYLASKTKGANNNLTISTVDQDGYVDASDAFTEDTTNFLNVAEDSTTHVLTTAGQDWKLSGIEGTVVTNDDTANVYSNSATFSANLSKATAGNDITVKISGGTSFQLGKNVSSAGKYNVGISTINSNKLTGNDGTTLAELRSLDYSNQDNVIKAQKTLEDIATQVATERGRLGTIQKNVLGTNQTNLEDQLAIVTESEATISNTDAALETSRLARQELIADSAMSAILYARSFSQFAVSSLFQ